jgi:uncharacterized protein (TIGR02271 family)
MDRDMTQFTPQHGMDVIGADGEKVGEIDAVEREYFVVRKGFFFPQDHYIPLTAVSSFDDEAVYLNVTKDEALEQDWGNAPVSDHDTLVGGTVVEDTDMVGRTDAPEVASYDRDTDTLAGVENQGGYVDRGTDYVEEAVDHDRGSIHVHEEELVAGTHEVERGAVRVHKDVVEEQQSLEVPVTEEEVEVTRRRVDRAVTADDHAFEEGTIEVPLRGEEVDVEKRARVVEEIDLDKTARTHTERVSDTVRREEVTIEGDDVKVDNIDRDKL